MSNVVIKENHLTYGGKAYFRGGADDIILGAIGEKRAPLCDNATVCPTDLVAPGKHDITIAPARIR